MYTVVLVIHLLLAISIIGLVLLQRSSGGGFVGGGGMGDFASARGTANALTRATTWAALLFFCTSIALALIVKHSHTNDGIMDTATGQVAPLSTPLTAPAAPASPAPAAPAPAAAPASQPSAPINKE